MLKINVVNARVSDRGYGLEVNGRSLEEIISTALGTKLDGATCGYGEPKNGALKPFECNSCDIYVIITPHPVEIEIETDEYRWDSVQDMEEDLNELYKKANAKTES